MQDGDHTNGHYITLFAEQLTRTFEVLVSLSLLAFTILTLLIDSVYICVSLIVNVLLISYIEWSSLVPTTSPRLRGSLGGFVRSDKLWERHMTWCMVRLGAGSAGTEGKGGNQYIRYNGWYGWRLERDDMRYSMIWGMIWSHGPPNDPSYLTSYYPCTKIRIEFCSFCSIPTNHPCHLLGIRAHTN